LGTLGVTAPGVVAFQVRLAIFHGDKECAGMACTPESIGRLVEDYRAQCLWFLRADYMPSSRAEILRALSLIERYGDRAGYLRAREIRSWLSRGSRPTC
jgi:hypothetical protein